MAIALASCGGGDDEKQSASRTITEQTETTNGASTTTTDTEPAPTTGQDTTERDQGTTSDSGEDSGGDAAPADDDKSSDSAPSGGDEQAAGAAVVTFFKALSSGDGDKACSLMIDRVKQQLEKGLDQTPQLKGKSCEELISSISKNYPDTIRTQLTNVKLVKTQAKGNTVLVTYKGAAGTPDATIPVIDDGGTWKIGVAAGGTTTP